jgi:hypothetical protein
MIVDQPKETKMTKVKEKSRARLYFPKGSVQPKGFKGLGTDEEVVVVIKGRVSEIADRASEWDPGKTLNIEIKSCDISAKKKGVTIDDAIKAARKKV